MRQINDFFQNTIDSVFYHYTGIDSLVGISETNALWASNVYFLNDSEEIIYASNVLEQVIQPRLIFSNQDDDPEIELLKQLQEWAKHFRTTTYNIFIFSLSEQASLLSQWRSYTPHGKGVSIGFLPETLNMLAKKHELRFAKCLYELHEQEEILGSLIEKLLITFRHEQQDIDITNQPPEQCYYSFLERFRSDVLQVLSIIKNRAFVEEQEWRLISKYYPRYDIPNIKFRKGASMLVPYIELDLGDNKPVFERVILGPSQHQNLSMSALSMFLNNKKLSAQTQNCVIPYREW